MKVRRGVRIQRGIKAVRDEGRGVSPNDLKRGCTVGEGQVRRWIRIQGARRGVRDEAKGVGP